MSRFIVRAALVLLAFYGVLALIAGTLTPVSHNTAGGYREACGQLPGMLGDDC